jgi:hypothetical protein
MPLVARSAIFFLATCYADTPERRIASDRALSTFVPETIT